MSKLRRDGDENGLDLVDQLPAETIAAVEASDFFIKPVDARALDLYLLSVVRPASPWQRIHPKRMGNYI